ASTMSSAATGTSSASRAFQTGLAQPRNVGHPDEGPATRDIRTTGSGGGLPVRSTTRAPMRPGGSAYQTDAAEGRQGDGSSGRAVRPETSIVWANGRLGI